MPAVEPADGMRLMTIIIIIIIISSSSMISISMIVIIVWMVTIIIIHMIIDIMRRQEGRSRGRAPEALLLVLGRGVRVQAEGLELQQLQPNAYNVLVVLLLLCVDWMIMISMTSVCITYSHVSMIMLLMVIDTGKGARLPGQVVPPAAGAPVRPDGRLVIRLGPHLGSDYITSYHIIV